MNAFEYAAPASLNEAVALLAAHGDRARPLAGGTDLLVQLRAGRYQLDTVVDVKRVPELNELSFDSTNGLTIGAAVPCYRIYEDSDISAAFPALIDAVSTIGGIATQGRASVGGNLCNAASSANSIPAMIALRGTCTISGPNGTRQVPVEEFCTGPGRTVLTPGELLVAIRFAVPKVNSGSCYMRFTPRNEMDIAVAAAGVGVQLSSDLKTIISARIALATVAPVVIVAEEAGSYLAGKAVSEETIAEAAKLAQAAARPRDSMRGTASHRRHLAGVLTRRALQKAISRASGEKES
jgi:CO/xanthine dehydrogenase FAD-binding subunit